MQSGTAGTGITLSLVSHGQAQLCAGLLADLAALRPPLVARLVYTANVPEELPVFDGLPFAVEVVRNPRPLGFGANHNQAFEMACTRGSGQGAAGGYFAVLNPDLRLAHDPFPALVAHLADPQVGIVAPQVLEASGEVADFARPLVSPWEVVRRRLGAMQTHAAAREPEWLAGMFLVMRCQTFASLHGFDTRYFLYCEDADLCARIRLHGLRLAVAREVSVTHLAQRASRRSLRPLLLHLSSLARFWSSPVYRRYRLLLRQQAAHNGGK